MVRDVPGRDVGAWLSKARCKAGRGGAKSFSGTGGARDVGGACSAAAGFSWLFDAYFASRSPSVTSRRGFGMRLMRISIRVLRLCAWRLYCARSLRARSVTEGCKVSIDRVDIGDLHGSHTFELQIVDQSLLLCSRDVRLSLLCWTSTSSLDERLAESISRGLTVDRGHLLRLPFCSF
jgi:hypothetical protein